MDQRKLNRTEELSERFQRLTIKDAFMFAEVMSDPEKCRRLLEIILEIEILEVTVITEKTMAYNPEYHGVRLDVLAVENDAMRRFNVEMQVEPEADLAKRSRYYHSQLDMNALRTGRKYGDLPDTYVIFICDFAWSAAGLYRSTYCSCCVESGEYLPDGRETIFLSTKGTNAPDVTKELVNFLRYVEDPDQNLPELGDDSFVRSLDQAVAEIKQNQNVEDRYMLLELMLDQRKEQGLEQGRKEGLEQGLKQGLEQGMEQGREQGLEQGENKLAALINLLNQEGKSDEVTKLLDDKVYRKQLLAEYSDRLNQKTTD